MKITVTQAHIDLALKYAKGELHYERFTTCCMVALALESLKFYNVFVGTSIANGYQFGKFRNFRLPREASDKIRDLRYGRLVTPFEFEVMEIK